MDTDIPMMDDGANGAAVPDTEQLLAQLGQDDPRMAALCRFLVQRQNDATQAVVSAAPVAETVSDDDALAQLQARHERLREIAHAMRRELHALRDRDAITAAALGACQDCWGSDSDCPQCHGRGRPGCYRPDPALYARTVAPAVRRLSRRPQAGQTVQAGPSAMAASTHDSDSDHPLHHHPVRAAGGFVAGLPD